MDNNVSLLCPELALQNSLDKNQRLHGHIFESSVPGVKEAAKAYNDFMDGPLRIAVVGSAGTGKSDVINKLLGHRFLPSKFGDRAVTLWPIRITYGPRWTLETDPPEASNWIPPVSDAESLHTALCHLNAAQVQQKEHEMQESTKRSKSSHGVTTPPKKTFAQVKEARVTLPVEVLRGIELIDTPGFDSEEVDSIRLNPILHSSHSALCVEARLPDRTHLAALLKRGVMCSSYISACFFGPDDTVDATTATFHKSVIEFFKKELYQSARLPHCAEQLARLYHPYCGSVNREKVGPLAFVSDARKHHAMALLRHVVMLQSTANMPLPKDITIRILDQRKQLLDAIDSTMRARDIRNLMLLSPLDDMYLGRRDQRSLQESIRRCAKSAARWYWEGSHLAALQEVLQRCMFLDEKLPGSEEKRPVDTLTRFKLSTLIQHKLEIAASRMESSANSIETKMREIWKEEPEAEQEEPQPSKGKKRKGKKQTQAPEKPVYVMGTDPLVGDFARSLDEHYVPLIKQSVNEIIALVMRGN